MQYKVYMHITDMLDVSSVLGFFVFPLLQIVVQALQCSHYSILWQLVKITEGSPSKVSRYFTEDTQLAWKAFRPDSLTPPTVPSFHVMV